MKSPFAEALRMLADAKPAPTHCPTCGHDPKPGTVVCILCDAPLAAGKPCQGCGALFQHAI